MSYRIKTSLSNTPYVEIIILFINNAQIQIITVFDQAYILLITSGIITFPQLSFIGLLSILGGKNVNKRDVDYWEQ